MPATCWPACWRASPTSGLTPVVAVEYEFYLLEDISGEIPRPRTGRVPGSERRPVGPRAYSLEDLHDLDGFFAQVESAAAGTSTCPPAPSSPSTAPASSR